MATGILFLVTGRLYRNITISKFLCTPILFTLCMIYLLYVMPAHAETVVFSDGRNTLSGHYFSPNSSPSESQANAKAVILFVHGDGPLNYDAFGYYRPIWNALRNEGFAVFSWDKPGIGRSTGNWLDQSMFDRQEELRAAIKHLQQSYGYKGHQIGLIGFSQAGWVAPSVAAQNPDVGFLVGIGFAVDWIKQGEYLTRVRVKQQKGNNKTLAQELDKYRYEIELLGKHEDYHTYKRELEQKFSQELEIDEHRFYFIQNNYQANSYNDFRQINQPTLILLGDKDLNVDIDDTERQISAAFSTKGNLTLAILPNATHGLLKSSYFSGQSPGLRFWIKFAWREDESFADGFFPKLVQWLDRLQFSTSSKSEE